MTAAVEVPPLEVGAEAPPRQYGPITRTHIVRYAGASGDFTPIHHDEELARKVGLPSVFSIGMLQAGILAGYATDWLGAERITRFGVRFQERVWPGDTLTCRGTVTAIEETSNGRRVTVGLRCETHAGAVVLTGSADFVVPA